jgi:hypothetical protein
MSEFKNYKRSQIAEVRAVTKEDIHEFALVKVLYASMGNPVSISDEDLKNGSPKLGDMIARNSNNKNDQWLIPKGYFEKNFENLNGSYLDRESTHVYGGINDCFSVADIDRIQSTIGYGANKDNCANSTDDYKIRLQKDKMKKKEGGNTGETHLTSELKNKPAYLYEDKIKVDFGEAIKAAKNGKRVLRDGWNGTGMFAYIVPAAEYPAMTPVAQMYFGTNGMVPYRTYWALKTAQGDVATWAPSASDSLAEDWIIIE